MKEKPAKPEVPDPAKEIVALTDAFCREHLAEDYAATCRRLIAKVARKRPSPFAAGKVSVWACAVVRAVGWVNFLEDKSTEPHMKASEIDRLFGVATSTAQAKSSALRKLVKMAPMDPDWTVESRLADNPMIWLLSVNGIVVDIRHLPREAQEVAFERGLIPYIPADRPGGR